ncbi:glycerol-3-phosphate 1-O-acyltransferase PlsY [Geobacillus sp. FSL K6-0789]|uniref:Glycerol-3-phosphate acyltransferase n=1 Tax=Geobacillus stearothermophilus TaxID=1422 RepID=A0A0K9HUH8_GEOSE|nr:MULTISPECIES: glycerol-3-phosphate 1-O-acyltransferase PlsY [Geobacillus]KAF6511647.1 Acyl-phosphate:glycerol-3-phosphate O-acyltransferase PlsY [Geobacillus stearothermophilus]KMY61714.1 glycerol-3-phosphate acyltransferase [Geobacillus stearothermophilus]KMY62469.1 glycerol-3-phosphate acyltransferase [Geobacillus stearothermophilus]KMY64673.1 glycerol-3-phosphate acyltransferase [Geobacillus stearothermophilus]MBR2517287.1 glycerol-3-phosphate 1-O-acyltransferase PlsY [Geobacillus sp.]
MTALILLLAYLLGSIPFGLLVGKIGYGIDIREHGSGNLGGTNTFRVLGAKAGTIVIVGDMLKGTLAASLPMFFSVPVHPLLAGAVAVVGHMYPVFAKFRGGKAVATSGGVMLFYSPLFFLSLIAVFLVVLAVSRYVSLSSMAAALYAVVYTVFFTDDIPLKVAVLLLASFIFYRHRANIKRILNKTEPKVKWPGKAS